MEINSIYNNVYENTYALQKQETAKKQDVAKREASDTMAVQKNSSGSKTKSTAEYMKKLEKLAPSVEFRMGSSYATDKTGKTLTINPKILEKMQNDPATEKKMKELIGGVEKMTQLREIMCRASGRVVVYRHGYIDANGKYCATAMTIKKDELNEKLRKQAEENTKKHIEKMREKARKKTKELAERLEEKAEEAKKKEEKQEPDSVVSQSDTAQAKAEKLLSEKLENSDDGEIYFDNEEMKIFIDAAKEESQGQPDQAKNPVVAGNNFDLQI